MGSYDYHAAGQRAGLASRSPDTRRPRIRSAAVIVACLLAFALWNRSEWPFDCRTALSQPNDTHPQSHDVFDWDSIMPSRELHYVPCGGSYQCARLLLPMDWSAPEENRWSKTVAIALMKLPANVSDMTDTRYRGEVYVNPGGPGASGINFVQGRGEYLSSTINDESAAFDIVGFDPRGIFRSTPQFSCFKPGNLQGRDMFSQNEARQTWSDRTLPMTWARSAAFGKMCDPGDDTSDEALIKSYMSTASVAADLVGLIEASGALRGAILEKLAASRKYNGLEALDANRVKELEYRPGEEKLQYWGFSYGTTLGGYFASMFPDKVKRLVLDGTGYLQDWTTARWMNFLTKTDESLRTLFTTCFAAGDKCAIFDPAGPEAIEATVMSLLDKLKTDPIPIWTNDMVYPDLLTYEAVIAAMFTATYDPYRKFPSLATGLHALANRENLNMTAIADFIPDQAVRCTDAGCTTKDCALEDGNWYHEPNVAVSCSDPERHLRNRTFADFQKWSDDLHAQSPLFGRYFVADSTMACNNWPIRTKHRFDGPFGANTSHPLLIVGNTLDPISPVDNVEATAKLFPGSGRLLTESGGHCSPVVPSRCTVKHIGRYMRLGRIPEEGTVCQTDYAVFEEEPVTGVPVEKNDRLWGRFTVGNDRF